MEIVVVVVSGITVGAISDIPKDQRMFCLGSLPKKPLKSQHLNCKPKP